MEKRQETEQQVYTTIRSLVKQLENISLSDEQISDIEYKLSMLRQML